MFAKIKNLISIFIAIGFLFGCGMGTKNAFQSLEKKDAAGDAASALDSGNPDKAIKILEKALEDDPEDYQLVSLLSAAYAQKHEVDMITIALNMGDDEGEDDSGAGSGITALWPFIPEATDEHIAGVNVAVELMKSIPRDSRTDADSFKLGLLSVVLASLQMKALDLDGNGSLSLQELMRLGSTDAATIMAALGGAAGALNGMNGSLGENSDQAGEQINQINEDIDNADGDSDAEKLRNYFTNE